MPEHRPARIQTIVDSRPTGTPSNRARSAVLRRRAHGDAGARVAKEGGEPRAHHDRRHDDGEVVTARR